MEGMRMLIPLMALSIPVLGIFYAAFNRWLQAKERQIEMTGQLTAEKTAQYAAHVERLEQRVRVLERVVTDGGGKACR